MVDISYDEGIDENPVMSAEEIMTLVLYGTSDRTELNIDDHLTKLSLSPDILPSKEEIGQAIDRLVGYGFVTHKDGVLTITDDGKLIESLPLGYPAAAAFCEAYSLNMLSHFLPFIALIEIGDCRYNRRKPMLGDTWTNNPRVNQLTVLTQYIYTADEAPEKSDLRALASAHNVSLTKYNSLRALVATLEKGTTLHAGWGCYLPITSDENRSHFEKMVNHITARAFPPSQQIIDQAVGTLGVLLQKALTRS